MNRRAIAMTALRMSAGYAVGILMLLYLPSWWLRAVAPATALIAEATSPYLGDIHTEIDNRHLIAKGAIYIDMTLVNGESLPPVPGEWKKHGDQTTGILMVTLAVWMAPVVGLQRRLIALPIALFVAALASGFTLSIEIQETALRAMGYEWLAGVPLMNSPENVQAFEHMERWYNGTRWAKAFLDGGGRLFFGTIAGLTGYTLPLTTRKYTENISEN